MKLYICTLLISLILATSVFRLKGSNFDSAKPEISITLQESFNAFKSRFEKDSIFQMSRIQFPLEGYNTEWVFDPAAEPDKGGHTFFIKDKKFYWKKEGWIMQKEFDNYNNDYTFESKKTKDVVIEIIKSKTTDLILTYKYTLKKGKWYLTYYGYEWY